MDLSSMAESRVSTRHRARSRAPNPALAVASRCSEMVVAAAVARGPAGAGAAAATAAVECESFPDVPPGFKKEHANPVRMALKRKANEGGFLNSKNKKAKNEDASSNEEEEYPLKWPDFDWVRPGGGPKVTYTLNFPRATISLECTEDIDDELCWPLTRRAPPNAEIEAMVEDLRVAIKRWVYFYP